MAVVRDFGAGDLQAVLRIWNASLSLDPTTETRLTSWLYGDPNFAAGGGFFVACEPSAAGAVVGFVRAVVRRVPNETLGVEPSLGFVSVVAVDPAHRRKGFGTALLERAKKYLIENGRTKIFVCGKTGSAPGYLFPGVDVAAYAPALALFRRCGFEVDHTAVAMLGVLAEMNVPQLHAKAMADPRSKDVVVRTLTAADIPAFFAFINREFPGDWVTAVRAKIASGRLGEVLIALLSGDVVGYCQWEGEHFGPFGTSAAARNKGVGAKLFAEAASRISANDGRSIWFNWADPDAERFYTRQGLKPFRKFAILTANLNAAMQTTAEVSAAASSVAAVPVAPKIADRQRVMIIGAHIGDNEIAGGLLATKYARAGHRVVMLHLTAGEKGNPSMDDQVYRAQRIKEAEASARIFGCEDCIVLAHKDAELQTDQATYLEVCDLIRKEQPDIIFTHWRGSFHRDHRATYQISMEASFLAALPGIKRDLPAHCIKGMYYLENWEDQEDYKPDFWVDIDEDTMQTWVRGCQAHSLLRGEVSFHYLEHYTGLAAKRGTEVGAKYAVCVSLPPISRKRRVDFLPWKTEPVLVF